MPALAADALHPNRTCNDCRRLMVTAEFALTTDAPLPAGLTVHAAAGACRACCPPSRTPGDLVTTRLLSRVDRGPAMPHEHTLAGYDRWKARREARLTGGRA